MLDLLREHNFIREQELPSSKRQSRFVHIKQADRILANDPADAQVAQFYEAVANAAR